MADTHVQLKDKNGNNLFPTTSMAYVTAAYTGGITFDAETNTVSTANIPIASVYNLTYSLGSKQAKITPGFHTSLTGATVGQMRYWDITSTVNTGAVTLSAGCAYRILATANTITLNAETFTATQYGLEGHAVILVTNNSYLTLGTNVVLGSPLMNDAVNNCTLRFHDGHCIIDVEDHDAAHTVTVSAGTGNGTLYQYCSSAYTTTNDTPAFISISDALDGKLVTFGGVSISGERHIAGNGIERTSLTGNVTPHNKTYITHAAFSGLTALTGGTVHTTDCAVITGATATFSSPIYVYEKITVDGMLRTPGGLNLATGANVLGAGSVNLAGTQLTVANNVTVTNVTVSSGYAAQGAINNTGGTLLLSSCTIAGNTATDTYGAIVRVTGTNNFVASDCVFSANKGYGAGFAAVDGVLSSCTFADNTKGGVWTSNTTTDLLLKDCTFSAGQGISIRRGGTITMSGHNKIQTVSVDGGTGGQVLLAQDAIVDLTGNTNATAIDPGSGVVFPTGGATIYPSAGMGHASYLGGGTFTAITNDGKVQGFIGPIKTAQTGTNRKLALLVGNAIIDCAPTQTDLVQADVDTVISGCTITNGQSANGGAIYVYTVSEQLLLKDVFISACGTDGNTTVGGAFYCNASNGYVARLSGTTITGCTATLVGGAIACNRGGRASLTSCVISGNTCMRARSGDDLGPYADGTIYLEDGNTIGTIGFYNYSGYVIFRGSNTLGKLEAYPSTAGLDNIVTISAGASITLTSSIDVRGGTITVLAGGCTINGTTFGTAGTDTYYAKIESSNGGAVGTLR